MNVFSFSGAYYYYNPEGNKSYEATLLDVKDYSIAKQIPYRFVQKSYKLCIFHVEMAAYSFRLILSDFEQNNYLRVQTSFIITQT